MWSSATKRDLIIEVWEKLDCENVGASEIQAIETVLTDVIGPHAVDSPMTIARWLADEGAELRHSEIMELHVKRAEDRPYAPALRDVLNLKSLSTSLSSIRRLENARSKYSRDGDRDGIRHVCETAVKAKTALLAASGEQEKEIAQWLTIWLQTPQIFESWIQLRIKSAEFLERFGALDAGKQP